VPVTVAGGEFSPPTAAEAEELEAVERERARRRQAATQLASRAPDGHPIFGGGNISTTEEKGKTRDKIAAAVGLGSGRTYDKAAKVFGFEHLPLHRGA